MTKLHDLASLGQSVWLDYIRRAFITSGEMQKMIEAGITGMTSNPAIFEQAIAGSDDYDPELRQLAAGDKSTIEIYERLAIDDVQRAADLLRPVYERTGCADGYISLEVNPELAYDSQGTITEARRLFATLDRPNVMIKVPATEAGIQAIETLIGEGINVNVTLMFSLAHYDSVAEAYIRGLERFSGRGGDLSRVSSVASFFLSRIDSAVDVKLDAIGTPETLSLRGKIAIANAKVTYQRFLETFSGPRWENLAGMGARSQRVLWASTSTKNPAYPDTMYVDELIGPDSVNTIPPATLQAFMEHGTPAVTVTEDVDIAETQLASLSNVGLSLDEVTDDLQTEGVEKFVKPFASLLTTIDDKVAGLRAEQTLFKAQLGSYQDAVDRALSDIRDQDIMGRIWAHDHTVWAGEPEEITNRLGWLHAPELMVENLDGIQALVEAVREGYDLGNHKDYPYRDVLLLGMGGSSLAPGVFSKIFSADGQGLRLNVLDSTDPGAILSATEGLDPARTLFIVSTKSGGTVETLSFFKYFYNWTADSLGQEEAGQHFVVITDPGSKLADIARQCDFRATFLNDPNIGGRYAALSYFGLVPAALVGVDIPRLLDRAQAMARLLKSGDRPNGSDNPGAWLGAVMGVLAKSGRDKVTLFSSPALANYGDWVEQLVAESTGKSGVGILPVVGESMGAPEVYGDDRLFIYLQLDGDQTYDEGLEALAAAGHPVVTIRLGDRYDIGGQFMLWEMATAVVGHILGIQPFDQPNVEAAKVLARQMVAAYQEEGQLPQSETAPLEASMLANFLDESNPGDYIAIQAYIQPTAEAESALQAFRMRLRDQTRLATTLGFGPRFLHSTGQLHKGDGGNGLFIQFTAGAGQDVPIPNEPGSPGSSISFGVLKEAQALGDAQALQEAGRRLIRFRLDGDATEALTQLITSLR
ncbi:MAG: bifunctional transaldolase/phosoglucose isomerase [Candidatus Promineifilaceae bacterium]